MRLIDADKLKSAFETCDICKECLSKSARCAYECTEPDFLTPGIRRVIDAQPTVDAVPVIRCKDCTFGHFYNYKIGKMYCVRPDGLMEITPTAFCSYAERKEKNNERMG